MKIKCIKVGILATNCYILEFDGKCLIIDPGDDFEKIKSNIDCKVVGVLLTHKHFDHLGALEEVLNYYNVFCFSFENLIEGDNIIENIKFKVIFNPGHTMDSVSYLFDNYLFCGDFIFEGTIGRCDLGGNFDLMKNSIKQILKSEINYKLYPGHGNYTFLNLEKDSLLSWLK